MSCAVIIKQIRTQMCLDQEEFGKKLNLTKAAICNYERGVRIPRFPTIKKIIKLAKSIGLTIPAESFLQ